MRFCRRAEPPVEVPPEEPDPDFEIPPEVNCRLLRRSLIPLMATLASFGKGKPGITRETEVYWVLRDDRGRVIGGAMASDDPEDDPALDIEVVREHRRQGHGTRLVEAITAAGIDYEKGSDASLEREILTPLGYAFQVGRRAKRRELS